MATTLNPKPSQTETTPPDVLNQLLARVYLVNWEAIAYVVIFILAIFTRFYMLGERVMSHDESLHTRYSYNLAVDGNFQHTPLMHGPILFHFTALFYFLFGANDFTSRLYAAILGVLVVMMPLLFRRWLGRWGALLASVMLLISPITMYYNRYIRHDTPNIFFSLLMIYGMFMYLSGSAQQRRREVWLYLIAGAMLMSLGSKETAFIYIAIFGIYLAAYWFIHMFAHFRGIAGKSTFYTVMMAFGVGGVAALGMFVTLSVNLGERPFFQAITTSANYSVFITWTLAVIAGVAGLVMFSVWAGYRNSSYRLSLRDGLGFFGLSFGVSTLLIWFEELSRLSHNTTGVSAPVVPDAESSELVLNAITRTPIIAAWVLAAFLLGIIIITWRRGWWQYANEHFPELDVIVVIGTLILPWATPIIIYATGMKPTNYTDPQYLQITLTSLLPMLVLSTAVGLIWNWRKWLISTVIFYALFGFFFTTMFTNPNGVGTGIIGSLGYWLEQQEVRRGNQPQYYYLGIIMPMYEYLPTIGSILAMGAGLTWFWRFKRDRTADDEAAREEMLAQITAEGTPAPQETLEPEYDPLAAPPEAPLSPKLKRKINAETLNAMPFLPFVAWWAIWNLIGYTLAGEKMPWLAIHLALPMILLTGWYFGRIFSRIEWDKFRNLGWLYLLLLPLAYILGARLVAPFIFGNVPFTDLSQAGLAQSGQWVAVAAIVGIIAVGITQLVERTGGKHLRHMVALSFFLLTSVFTFRAAWMASFVNYDLANEFLVYAHAAPAVKTVLSDIEELSLRTTDGMGLSFVYDNEVSWPYSWYFRDFPNGRFVGASPNAQQLDNAVVAVVGEANRAKFEPLLDDRFYHYEYIRLWWPMQDYFGMTPQRVSNTFSPFNPQGGRMREALWHIWWNRDYSTYGTVVGRDFSLARWPVADRMHFYVRKDIAAQVWNLGAGQGVAQNPLSTDAQVNVCNANWMPTSADAIYGVVDGLGSLNQPVDVAIAPNGDIYVAEQWNHQISVFNPAGERVQTFGERGGPYDANGLFTGHDGTLGRFERPNGITINSEGEIFVADTWNFRIQRFNSDGEPLQAWGSRDERGEQAQVLPMDGFWGPRDVLVDERGYVYVSDTGNKRIRVYTQDDSYLFDLGGAGSADGQLNEPSGLAIDAQGRLFVADTWNRRVSVFDVENRQFLYNIRVRAWYNDRGNRPYLAIDNARGQLYVTDPDAGRVLVYTLEGDCVGSFGQAGADPNMLTDNQFIVAGGIATDEDGNVYVVDTGAGRVLRFPPFENIPMTQQEDAAPESAE